MHMHIHMCMHMHMRMCMHMRMWLLRKDEDVGQVIPEVKDELQVYVGLARAAWS